MPSMNSSPGDDRGAAMRTAIEISAPPESSRHHAIFIVDARFRLGHARALAWDVVCQGDNDLSTFLCRDVLGAYFLLCRSGRRLDKEPGIVPLSSGRATVWFEAHPVHFADWDAPH